MYNRTALQAVIGHHDFCMHHTRLLQYY